MAKKSLDKNYKDFFYDAPIPMMRINIEDGTIDMMNDLASKLVKYQPGIQAKNVIPEQTLNYLQSVLKENKNTTQTITITNKDGDEIVCNAVLKKNCKGKCIECSITESFSKKEIEQSFLKDMKIISENLNKMLVSSSN